MTFVLTDSIGMGVLLDITVSEPPSMEYFSTPSVVSDMDVPTVLYRVALTELTLYDPSFFLTMADELAIIS